MEDDSGPKVPAGTLIEVESLNNLKGTEAEKLLSFSSRAQLALEDSQWRQTQA